jgi:hypothetical protein
MNPSRIVHSATSCQLWLHTTVSQNIRGKHVLALELLQKRNPIAIEERNDWIDHMLFGSAFPPLIPNVSVLSLSGGGA